MAGSVFDHPWLGGLFAEPDIAECLSAEAQLTHMLTIEAAYARVLGQVGRVDSVTAERAATHISAARPDLAALADGVAVDGVVVPALVRALRQGLDAEAQAALHKGLTSQDVIDTALVLALRGANDVLLSRLGTLADHLDDLSTRFGAAPMMGRTRMQAALPITVAERIAPWRHPLDDHRARLAEMRPRLERLQFGGAAGDRAAAGAQADAISDALAAALSLHPTAKAWHAMRDSLGEYAGWLSLVTGTLGKMGQDLCLMAQQGIDEVRTSGGGGSSAMAHKQNPVQAETLVALARFNAVQLSGMHQALIHEQERSGAAWTLEWMILPQMVLTTGRALALGSSLCAAVERLGPERP